MVDQLFKLKMDRHALVLLRSYGYVLLVPYVDDQSLPEDFRSKEVLHHTNNGAS